MKSEENEERNSKIFYFIFSYIRYQNKKFSLLDWNVPFSITSYTYVGIWSQLLLQGSHERFGSLSFNFPRNDVTQKEFLS